MLYEITDPRANRACRHKHCSCGAHIRQCQRVNASTGCYGSARSSLSVATAAVCAGHLDGSLGGGDELLAEGVVGFLLALRQDGHAGAVQDRHPPRQPQQRRRLPAPNTCRALCTCEGCLPDAVSMVARAWRL